jgi:hypothetical protein
MYDFISRYKPVDALGKQRSHPGQAIDRGVYEIGRRTYNDLAVAKYRPYKFVICCENSRYNGYVTEKMISAMLANAIPIYLGAPDVVAHFNPASFVHVGAYANWEQALDRIRELDTNDEKYKQMLSQPWCYNNTLGPYFSPTLLVQPLQQLLHNTPSTAARRPLPRQNIPRISLGSAPARTMRAHMRQRVAPMRAVLPPPVRILSSAHAAIRARRAVRRRITPT